MSVIVKGMKMSKACMHCPMFNGIGCKATMKMFDEMTNVAARVKDCPLVELPEKHGRLIDADKLTVSDVKTINGDYLAVVHLNEIEYAPTVIESEE